jgi:hypothetical protein
MPSPERASLQFPCLPRDTDMAVVAYLYIERSLAEKSADRQFR